MAIAYIHRNRKEGMLCAFSCVTSQGPGNSPLSRSTQKQKQKQKSSLKKFSSKRNAVKENVVHKQVKNLACSKNSTFYIFKFILP